MKIKKLFSLHERVLSRIAGLEQGIWYIGKIKKGKHVRFLANSITKLPEAMTLAQFQPYKYTIAKRIDKLTLKARENERFVRTASIMKVIDEVFKEQKNKKR